MINSLIDYTKSLKLITFVGSLFRVIENCKSAVSEKSDNISLSTVIHCLDLKGLPAKEVHKDMLATLGQGPPSYSMVKK